MRAVCAAESYPQEEDSVRLLVLALLKVLGEDRVPRADRLWDPVYAALHDLCDRYDKPVWGRCAPPTGTTTWAPKRRLPGWWRCSPSSAR
jgi:hypothetical protein